MKERGSYPMVAVVGEEPVTVPFPSRGEGKPVPPEWRFSVSGGNGEDSEETATGELGILLAGRKSFLTAFVIEPRAENGEESPTIRAAVLPGGERVVRLEPDGPVSLLIADGRLVRKMRCDRAGIAGELTDGMRFVFLFRDSEAEKDA